MFVDYLEVKEAIYPQKWRFRDGKEDPSPELRQHLSQAQKLVADLEKSFLDQVSPSLHDQVKETLCDRVLELAFELIEKQDWLFAETALDLAAIAIARNCRDPSLALDIFRTFDRAADETQKVYMELIADAEEKCEESGSNPKDRRNLNRAYQNWTDFQADVMWNYCRAASMIPCDNLCGKRIRAELSDRLAYNSQAGVLVFQPTMHGLIKCCENSTDYPAAKIVVEDCFVAIERQQKEEITKCIARKNKQEVWQIGCNMVIFCCSMLAYFHGFPALTNKISDALVHFWQIVDGRDHEETVKELTRMRRVYAGNSYKEFAGAHSVLEQIDLLRGVGENRRNHQPDGDSARLNRAQAALLRGWEPEVALRN